MAFNAERTDSERGDDDCDRETAELETEEVRDVKRVLMQRAVCVGVICLLSSKRTRRFA